MYLWIKNIARKLVDKDWSRIVIYLGCFGILLSMFMCMNSVQELNRLQKNQETLKKNTTHYRSKLGQEVAKREALEVSHKEIVDQLWVKDDSLKDLTRAYKKLEQATTIVQEVRVESLFIPFEIPVETPFFRTWDSISPYFQIHGYATQNGVGVDSLKLKDKIRMVTGVEKSFFKHTVSTSASHSNPLFKTTEIETQSVVIRKKRIGIGPSVIVDYKGELRGGVGVHYSLLSF